MSSVQTKPITITGRMILELHETMDRDKIVSDAPMPQKLFKRMLKISPVWAHQMRYRIATVPHLRTKTLIISKYFEPSDTLRRKYSRHGSDVPTALTYSAINSCFLGEAHGWKDDYKKPNGEDCGLCNVFCSSLVCSFYGDYRMLELFCAHWEEVHQE